MSKAVNKRTKSGDDGSENTSPSRSKYLIVFHSHTYADRTYGTVRTEQFQTLKSLARYLSRSSFVSDQVEFMEREFEVKKANILPMLQSRATKQQKDQVKELETEFKQNEQALRDKFENTNIDTVEAEDALLKELISMAKDYKNKLENEMVEKQDDFCDFHAFEMIQSIIVIDNNGQIEIHNI